MTHIFDDGEQLRADIHATLLHFLRIELEVASTMLDAAAGSRDKESGARRSYRAQQALDEVARHLARGDELPLTDSEREELGGDLARLTERLRVNH